MIHDDEAAPYRELYFFLLNATKEAQKCDDPKERRRILVTALEEAKAREIEILKNEEKTEKQ